MKKIYCFIAAMAAGFSATHGQLLITVTNPSAFPREELVEVPVDSLGTLPSDFRVSGPNGKEIAWQLTHDGLLLFPVNLAPGESEIYTVGEGHILTFESEIAWTFRPDRLDDFAWENGHAGYRLYGPAFKRNEGGVYGYDIWCKRQQQPVLDIFYNGNAATPQISYHEDHGLGFDGFAVGPTLGAGAFVLTSGDTLLYRECYRDFEILDNGPLRLTIRFTIDPFEFDGNTVTEVRTLSLDAGSHFNRTAIEYRGLETPCTTAAGIVVHPEADFQLLPEIKAVAVEDPTDRPGEGHGNIFIGLIYPEAMNVRFREEKISGVAGHALAEGIAIPGSPCVYYWGSGWSVRRDAPDFNAWQLLIKRQAESIRRPLEVTVSDHPGVG